MLEHSRAGSSARIPVLGHGRGMPYRCARSPTAGRFDCERRSLQLRGGTIPGDRPAVRNGGTLPPGRERLR